MKRKPDFEDGGASRASGPDPSPHWDGRLRKFYEAHSLSAKALVEIRNATPARSYRSALAVLRPAFRRPGIAAVGAAAAMLTIGLLYYGGAMWQQERLYARLAAEVAGNHAKHMPAEFAGTDLKMLAPHFDRLEFALADAEAQLPNDTTLQGARYCTLHGRLAAQLQLITAAGRPQTLYVAPAGTELAALSVAQATRIVAPKDKSGDSDPGAPRVEVRIWRAGALVFGLAADSTR